MVEENYEPLAREVTETTTPSSANPAIKASIHQIRLSRGTPDEKLHCISEIVIRELKKNATLIKAPSFRFLFDKDSKRTYRIGDNREFRTYLNEHFSINREFEYIWNDIEREVGFRGLNSDVYMFSFWDKKNLKLFIDRRDGKVITLDGKRLAVVDNGHGGIFFLTPENTDPITWERPESTNCCFSKNGLEIKAFNAEGSRLLKVLTDTLQFTGPLDPNEQKSLLLIVIYLLFFESIHPSKPILLITGPKGSGKSALARNIGRILFGKQYQVVYLRNDERDFITACAHNYLLALDNVEAKNTWLLDLIAMIATGGGIPLRELYTTSDVVLIRPRVFLMINAIDPKLRRNDIADRLLIFQLDRITEYVGQDDLTDAIHAKLPKIWGELLCNLQFIIQKLKKGGKIPTGKFRLQDLEVFAKRICSDPKEVEALLVKMEGLRSEYSLDFDNFCILLDYVFDDEITESIGPLTAKELLEKFQEVVARDRSGSSDKSRSVQCFFRNPKSIGRKIHEIKPELERGYGLIIHKERAGVVRYEFPRRRGG